MVYCFLDLLILHPILRNHYYLNQVIGTTNSIEAGFFVMAPLNSETSYKISIHRQDGPMILHGSNNIGYQINCIIYTV